MDKIVFFISFIGWFLFLVTISKKMGHERNDGEQLLNDNGNENQIASKNFQNKQQHENATDGLGSVSKAPDLINLFLLFFLFLPAFNIWAGGGIGFDDDYVETFIEFYLFVVVLFGIFFNFKFVGGLIFNPKRRNLILPSLIVLLMLSFGQQTGRGLAGALFWGLTVAYLFVLHDEIHWARKNQLDWRPSWLKRRSRNEQD